MRVSVFAVGTTLSDSMTTSRTVVVRLFADIVVNRRVARKVVPDDPLTLLGGVLSLFHSIAIYM